MLVARAQTKDHQELLLLGLSADNLRRLVMEQPIDLHITTTDGPLKIVIFVGATEDAMQAQVFSLIDQTTVIDRYSREVP
jgi:hypothetical protein